MAGIAKMRLMALVLSCCASSLCAAQAAAGSCIDWPRAMAQSDLARHPGGTTVLVQPFTDFTKQAGDEWLVLGLRDLSADLLRASRELRVLSGPAALASKDMGPPDFAVGGMFQHAENALRVFIRLSDGKNGKLLAQEELQFPYPDNQEFFTDIAEAATKLMAAMKVRPDGRAFEAVRTATASTKAYEAFAKGRQALESYQPGKAAAAALLFAEAKRLDYRSPLGYEGLIALHAFLGLVEKERGQPFSSAYQKAQGEYVQMAREARPASGIFGWAGAAPTKAAPGAFGDRFLAGNAAFLEGIEAAQAGNWKAALEALRRAVQLVPEDALAWYHLSRMEAKGGDAARAQEASQKALAINPCIEK